jgi:hypothetical protein
MVVIDHPPYYPISNRPLPLIFENLLKQMSMVNIRNTSVISFNRPNFYDTKPKSFPNQYCILQHFKLT